MDVANQFIFGIGLLLLLSVVASRISDRLGVPLLLVFLVLGMLVGEEGPGGIVFNDVFSANLLANLALAIILFDGGLRTPLKSFRLGLKPALSLATVGVLITAGITGAAATLLFELRWIEGLLIGAIVGSTDAAAVFYLLHARGLELSERIRSTLEIESGSNDPMAVFLTLALIEVIKTDGESLGWQLAQEFLWQLGLGAAIGLVAGLALVHLLSRMRLAHSLYPLLGLAGGLTLYGLTASLGGSGFLAAYLGGLLIGNRVQHSGNDIRRFHDGMAWLSQIGLFLLLGLLVVPSELVDVAPLALLVALTLIVVARPVAVFLCLAPFGLGWRAQMFIGWVGLRGAVPIVLGLYPLLAGITEGRFAFNVAFFVVLVSLIVQGWTVAPLARALGLQFPRLAVGSRLAEIEAPGLEAHELLVYRVLPDSPALGNPPSMLPRHSGARPTAIVRAGALLPADDDPRLEAGDLVYVLAPAPSLAILEAYFGRSVHTAEEQRFFGRFVLNASAGLGDVAEAYGVVLPDSGANTIAELFHTTYGRHLALGDRVRLGDFEFIVRQFDGDRLDLVGLNINRRV